ncbi:hypothetical protein V8B97DRAFT_2025365 [Scleroderma yunnanense]
MFYMVATLVQQACTKTSPIYILACDFATLTPPIQVLQSRGYLAAMSKKRARVSAAKDQPTLQAVHQITEAGKQTHLWAAKTRATYARHVHQACKWLQGHFLVEGHNDSEVYGDQIFKDTFECIPNQCLDKALALYLSWRGFQEHCSQSTINGIQAAFKMLDSNPVCSAEVNDVVASIRHKVNSEGAECSHSGMMQKEHMDCILAWSVSVCPLNIPFQYIQSTMAGLESAVILSKELNAVAFTLWTRNYELVKLKCGDINLDNAAIDGVFLKYLQGEEKSLMINDLSNYFEWVKFFHLGHPMGKGDFLFPAVGANGVLQPGEPLSHDTIQKWIDKAVVGSGIPRKFSTHCFHHGGGWVDGEHWDILMCYLLDELHCYENDHSDALSLISWDADGSLAGEATLVQPASTEVLCLAHTSLMADVAALHTKVNKVYNSQAVMSSDVRDMCEKFGDLSNWVQKVLTSTLTYDSSPPCCESVLIPIPTSHPPATLHAKPPHLPAMTSAHSALTASLNITTLPPQVPSLVGPQRTACLSALPVRLVISKVLVLHEDGMQTPKSEFWKDIVWHWKEGEPWLGLHVPLKDWPHHYYNGQHRQKFNTKYYQQHVTATEFIDKCQENKAAFFNAYGSAICKGHMELWKTIMKAWNWYHRDGQCCCHIKDEAYCNNSPAPERSGGS